METNSKGVCGNLFLPSGGRESPCRESMKESHITAIGGVKLDLSSYDGVDAYSDGPVEEELLDIVKRGDELRAACAPDSSWPIFYHLHPARANILAWYEFRGSESALEIGAGCGAITGLLAENCRQVTCAEISLRRSQVNAWRHRHFENITIRVGNFADMTREGRRYDIVTLIGVLEYARSYYPTAAGDPYAELLTAARKCLTPDGVLFVAIENRFGLKYWAGAREDHSARLYDSLEGYPLGAVAETFSHSGLEALLRQAGLQRLNFHYPYPDYKFAREIYSDARLPEPGELKDPIHNYDLERVRNFREELVFSEIVRAGQFPFFANSFLVAAQI